LVCVDEGPLLRDIQRLLGGPIRQEVVEGFEPDQSIRPEPIRMRTQGHRGAPRGQGRPGSRGQAPHSGGARGPRRWSNRSRRDQGARIG
jgi:ATP-dependent RNA helicase RhlE